MAAATQAVPWQTQRRALDDSVPVFVVTDGESRPLEYERSGEPTLVCFIGADGALAELERCRTLQPQAGLRIQPVGLGTALERAREGRTLVVPVTRDVRVAREAFPDGEDWEGGAIPLFGCHQLQRRRSDGTLATPLFLSSDDAKAALADADPERELGLHLVCTSVQSMVSMIEEGSVGPMDVVPPKRSVEYCTTGGTLTAGLSDDEGELPPGVTKGNVMRALPDIFGLQDPASQNNGLFPGM